MLEFIKRLISLKSLTAINNIVPGYSLNIVIPTNLLEIPRDKSKWGNDNQVSFSYYKDTSFSEEDSIFTPLVGGTPINMRTYYQTMNHNRTGSGSGRMRFNASHPDGAQTIIDKFSYTGNFTGKLQMTISMKILSIRGSYDTTDRDDGYLNINSGVFEFKDGKINLLSAGSVVARAYAPEFGSTDTQRYGRIIFNIANVDISSVSVVSS